MKAFVSLGIILLVFSHQLTAQRACASFTYQQEQLRKDPTLAAKMQAVESFIQQRLSHPPASSSLQAGGTPAQSNGLGQTIIKIPVVVHIIYHTPGENISDLQVAAQIKTLNECFRRANADAANTPSYFKGVAADCGIEFALATSDPKRRSTTGIVRTYSPVTTWSDDDAVKSSTNMGDDAWDATHYFNIWVCNLTGVAGYSSLPGGPLEKDGIVISYSVFGPNSRAGYELGKTAVHETGHWLGLRHIWGDDFCGDDLVADTPKQSTFSSGCPSGMRVSCDNAPYGDMYMNFMDYTDDACTNTFTQGQKERMRTLFEEGGFRNNILTSKGLSAPLYSEAPLPSDGPTWLQPRLYPNPASTTMTLDLAYDARWVGQTATVTSLQGQVLMQYLIASKVQTLNVSKLTSGMYFLTIKRPDGAIIQQKFIKL